MTDRAAMMEKKQDAHDKAMFGPKWRDSVNKYDEISESIADSEVHKEIPLANLRVSFLLSSPGDESGTFGKTWGKKRSLERKRLLHRFSCYNSIQKDNIAKAIDN